MLTTHPTADRRATFPVQLEQLSTVLGFATQFCTELNISPTLVGRIELVLEELFANVASHGVVSSPQTGQQGQVWLTLRPINDGVRLVFEDSCKPFNPLAAEHIEATEALTGLDLLERPVGGLGRLLVARLCAASQYAYDESSQRNVLRLDFRAD